MDIYGIQKMTLLDYPGHVACTVFFGGCDFRCPFCHNYELVCMEAAPVMDHEELLEYLKKRAGLIDGVVLTGGELAALVLIDSISRMVDGVLTNEESAMDESFGEGGLLEYPQYTRPYEWRGRKVPDILLSGHHANVDAWRHEKSVERTRERRPDLFKGFNR